MQQVIKKIRDNRQSIWSVSILSVQAVFFGFFVSLFFIDATANFLIFHTVRVFPEAIAASGLAGIIITQVMFALESVKTYRLRYFLQYSVILVAFLSLIGLHYMTYTKFFLFFYFAAFLPFSIILINILHSSISSIRISSHFFLKIFIDVMFLGGVTAGGIWSLIFKRTNTIPVEFILTGILLAGIILHPLINHYTPAPKATITNKPVKTLISYFSELPSKGILLITALFILFSALNFTMIDFTFLQTVETIFKSSVYLTKFLVVFFVVATVLSYSFKLFVYQNLIKNFDLSKAVIFAPLISILAISGISILMLFPSQFNFGYSYSLLFLILVFSRVFVHLTRESFEFYSLRMNFISQESLSEKKIDTGIISIFNFWALFLSGMILLIIKAAEFNDVQTRLYFNLLVAAVWFVIALALNKTYSRSVQHLTGNLLNDHSPAAGNEIKSVKGYDENSLSYYRYILNYQSYYQPHHFRKLIKQLPDNLKQKLGISLSKNNFVENREQDIQSRLSKPANGQTSFFDTANGSRDYMIETLTESVYTDDRLMAVKLIAANRNPRYINILKLLIRDQEDEVKRQAISAITKFRNTELIYEALEYLPVEDYADLVCDVLVEIGPEAVGPLSDTFNKATINLKYQSKIIKTVAQIPSEESYRFLLQKLDYPNKSVVHEAASALIRSEFKAGQSDPAILLKAIDKTAGNCAWLLSLILTLEQEKKADQLVIHLKEEFNDTQELLFMLLELRYGKKLIRFIRKLRSAGYTNEHREYGVEILKTVVDPEIKAGVFPLLHNISRDEMIRLLQKQYPITRKSPVPAIKDIINADLGSVSKWTKSSAILTLSNFQDTNQPEDIIAQMYNPDPVLSESAVYTIKKWGHTGIDELETRLPEKVYPKMVLLSENIDLNKYFLLSQKVTHLKGLAHFSHIKEEYLLQLAEVMDGFLLLKGNSQTFKTGPEEILPLFTAPYGELVIRDGGKNSKKVPENYLFGLNVYSGKLIIEAVSDSFLYVIRPENLTTVVLNFEEISDALFTYLNEVKIR